MFIYINDNCNSCSDENITQEFPLIREIPDCIQDLYYLSKIEEPRCVDFKTTKAIFENDLALFIDARDDISYLGGHIQGAINISFTNLFEEYDIDIADINNNIIAYGDEECFDESFCIGGSTNNLPYISSPNNNKVITEEKYYVIYCDGAGCEDSKELSWWFFNSFNITKILFFEGGFPEWKSKEMPIE